MFERFTEPARRVVVLAQEEARALRHNYIGTEHLLLGLFREEDGLAARVLDSLGLTVDEVSGEVARIIGQGDEVTTGQIPFTPRAKKVLDLGLREALSLGHKYVGTEHILLGIARENEGVASRILLDFGADADTIRNEVIGMLSGSVGARPTSYLPKSPPVAREVVDEIEQVTKQKEDAIEEHDFERPAQLRDRGRRLIRAARELEHAWSYEPPAGYPAAAPTPSEFHGHHGRVRFSSLPSVSRSPRRVSDYAPPYSPPLLLGWLLFAAALGIGILIGWGIWG